MDVVWKNQTMSKSIEVKGREKKASKHFPEKRKTMCKCCEVEKSLVPLKKQKMARAAGLQGRVAQDGYGDVSKGQFSWVFVLDIMRSHWV